VDFNVPIKEGEITDDTRIRAALETITYIIENGGKLILFSHLGRPKGKKVTSLSLEPVANALSGLIKREVKFVPSCVGKEVEEATQFMHEGEVMLLENTRFYPEEEKNDSQFAQALAKLGDVYVNDAFGSVHRAHASVEGVAHYFQEKAMGFLLEKEIKHLDKLLEAPERPFIAIIGGAKISGKIDVIVNLLPKLDKLLLGGGMVFTFFKAMNYKIGASIVEEEKVSVVNEILRKGKDKILLPVDIVIADRFDNEAQKKEVSSNDIPEGWMGLDIGPKSGESYASVIEGATTIFWNGPTGVFEFDNFACSTKAIAKQLAEKTTKGAITIIGGGDTISAINKFGFADKMTHLSTGGGASLEYLAGRKLPGIEALKN
jgi:phosphoglycerate kinase